MQNLLLDNGIDHNEIRREFGLSRAQFKRYMKHFRACERAYEIYGETILDNPVFLQWTEMLVRSVFEGANVCRSWLDFLNFARDVTSMKDSPYTFEQVTKDISIAKRH